jgi:cell volume regulation protein A
MPHELHRIEVALLAIGALLLGCALASRISSHSGIPGMVLFLVVGMLAGSEGPGRIPFEDYPLTFDVGTIALVLILFDGGLKTPRPVLKRALVPSVLLATVGVGICTAIVGLGATRFGLSPMEGLLLGAIVSSTDAAAVFEILGSGGVHLKPRVGAIIELESGLNDPMAVLLTTSFTAALATNTQLHPAGVALSIGTQLLDGTVVGFVIGVCARWGLVHIRLPATALYPVVTIAFAFLAYGIASLTRGSGLIAVYVAGIAIGDAALPFRAPLVRVHDFVARTSQIVMFLVLGLLVSPSELIGVAPVGLSLAALLALVARPLASAFCLFPLRYRTREVALVGWVGLRGAVPIILALIPVLVRLPLGGRIFNLIFFVVLVSSLVQGSSVGPVARRLGLASDERPAPHAVLEIMSARPLDAELMTFSIAPECAVSTARVVDVPFPEGAALMLIVRGAQLIAPRGDTVLEVGDHAYVFCRKVDVPTIRLLFGAEEES